MLMYDFSEASRKLLNPFLWLTKHQWLIAIPISSMSLDCGYEVQTGLQRAPGLCVCIRWVKIEAQQLEITGCERSVGAEGIQWETYWLEPQLKLNFNTTDFKKVL